MAKGTSRKSDSANRLVFISALCLFPLAFCLSAGCGRKTHPQPPELVVPETIATLTAEATGDGVVLLWKRPEKYASGSRMPDLGGFRIERSADGAPFAFLTQLEVSDRDRFRKIRRFRYVDALATPGHRYQYRLFSVTLDGYVSQASNVAEVGTPAVEHSQTDG